MLGTMYATIPVETESKTLQIGIGFASHQDAIWAAVRATAMARNGRRSSLSTVLENCTVAT